MTTVFTLMSFNFHKQFFQDKVTWMLLYKEVEFNLPSNVSQPREGGGREVSV